MAKFYATTRINIDEIRTQVSGSNIVLIEGDFINIGLSNEGNVDMMLSPDDSVKLWEKISIFINKDDIDLLAKK